MNTATSSHTIRAQGMDVLTTEHGGQMKHNTTAAHLKTQEVTVTTYFSINVLAQTLPFLAIIIWTACLYHCFCMYQRYCCLDCKYESLSYGPRGGERSAVHSLLPQDYWHDKRLNSRSFLISL